MKLVVLKGWFEENMSKEFIWQSSSMFAALVLFTKKPDGGLEFCIDCRDINSKRIKNWYPLQLINELLNRLWNAGICTKLDVWEAYNLLCIKEGDEDKLAFRARYGLFKHIVMQFETTNAPADIQGDINTAIREALDEFATAYLDDILIYSDLEEKHNRHVK